jgi:dynein heavy chain 1
MDGLDVASAPPAVNGNGNGTNGTAPSDALPNSVDPQILINHLSSLLQVTLGATEDELHHTDSLLGTSKLSETVQRCTRFAQEAQASSLYIQKLRLPTSRQIGGDDLSGIPLALWPQPLCPC